MGSSHSSQNTAEVPAFKIALVGAPDSGKSSVFLRYLKNQHVPYYIPTQRPVIENVVRKLNIPGHAIVSLTFWDLPGREDMDLRKSYFRNLDAAIVVVDMSDRDSIEMSGVWRREVLNQATITRPLKTGCKPGLVQNTEVDELPIDEEDLPILLLGNKYDLVDQRIKEEKEREINSDEMNLNDNVKTKEHQEERAPWNFNPAFPPQRGPDPGDEKPECVKLLERIRDEHNFVASVIVSAKDNDGSVESAIQSLVRHLVEKKHPNIVQKWKAINSPIDPPTANKESMRGGLEVTGLQTFDEVFYKSGEIVERINNVSKLQRLSVERFKEACTDMDIIPSTKCNFEDTIITLKEVLPVEQPLQVVEKNGFYELEIQTNRDLNLRKGVKAVFDIFNTEFAAASRAVLEEFPTHVKTLQKQDEQLSIMCEQEEIEKSVLGQSQLTQLQWVLERNRARVEHTRQCASQCIEDTKTKAEKIKAAMAW